MKKIDSYINHIIYQANRFTAGKTATETTHKIDKITSSFEQIIPHLSLEERWEALQAYHKLQVEEVRHYKQLQEKCPYSVEKHIANFFQEWIDSLQKDPYISNFIKKELPLLSLQEQKSVLYRTQNRSKYLSSIKTLSQAQRTSILQEEIQRIHFFHKIHTFRVKTEGKLERCPIEKLSKILSALQKYAGKIPKEYEGDSRYLQLLNNWNTHVIDRTLQGKPISESSFFCTTYFGKKNDRKSMLNELILTNIFYSSEEFTTKSIFLLAMQKIAEDCAKKEISTEKKGAILQQTLQEVRDTQDLSLISEEDIIKIYSRFTE